TLQGRNQERARAGQGGHHQDELPSLPHRRHPLRDGRAGGTGRTPLSCPAEPTAERPPFGAGPEIVTSALGPSPDGNRAFRFHSRWAAGLVLVPIFTNCLGRTPQ